MLTELEKIKRATACIRKRVDFKPSIAIVLGSGLGSLADQLSSPVVIPYKDIKYMPRSTTSSHAGELYFGYLRGVPVMLFKGRVHLYEGYSEDDVVRSIRIAHELGAGTLILTNSAGAINRNYKVGDQVLIQDHISSFVPSPIKGDIRRSFGLGLEFIDMSRVYDDNVYDILEKKAESLGYGFKKGVYLQVRGAQYETPAEIDFYGKIGADLVGMSTVLEAMAGVHAGMRIGAISTVTNMATGIENKKLSHEEVKIEGESSARRLGEILTEAIEELVTL